MECSAGVCESNSEPNTGWFFVGFFCFSAFKVCLGIRCIQGDNWFVLRDAIKNR